MSIMSRHTRTGRRYAASSCQATGVTLSPSPRRTNVVPENSSTNGTSPSSARAWKNLVPAISMS